jgi:hypothetical protein
MDTARTDILGAIGAFAFLALTPSIIFDVFGHDLLRLKCWSTYGLSAAVKFDSKSVPR